MKNHIKNTSKIYFKVTARSSSWNIFDLSTAILVLETRNDQREMSE